MRIASSGEGSRRSRDSIPKVHSFSLSRVLSRTETCRSSRGTLTAYNKDRGYSSTNTVALFLERLTVFLTPCVCTQVTFQPAYFFKATKSRISNPRFCSSIQLFFTLSANDSIDSKQSIISFILHDIRS